MESKAIDPVDFREAQHKHWDSAAVGWKEWSEFNDSADGHISERPLSLPDTVRRNRPKVDFRVEQSDHAREVARDDRIHQRAGDSRLSDGHGRESRAQRRRPQPDRTGPDRCSRIRGRPRQDHARRRIPGYRCARGRSAFAVRETAGNWTTITLPCRSPWRLRARRAAAFATRSA